jgi:phosphoribosylamine---glycine ligase
MAVLGPSRAAAEVEGSKVFTKELCERHGIPTARGHVVRDRDSAARALRDLGIPVVFKADGLASGKGVLVCRNADDVEAALVRFFEDRAFGSAGDRVVVEECLAGDEVSFMVLTDGASVVPLASARDYKRLGDGDQGPNTGGMGAISPAALPQGLGATILRDIVHPTINGLAQEGRLYRGVLYAGVMLTADGPKLLEYNCRLGDPETQAVLPRLEDDLLPLLQATARGELSGWRANWRHEAAACVVLAAGGYPEKPQRGDAISGVAEALARPGALLFHAATALDNGRLVTAGGRVLSVVGRGASLDEAVVTAYAAAAQVSFAGMQYRRDIGA